MSVRQFSPYLSDTFSIELVAVSRPFNGSCCFSFDLVFQKHFFVPGRAKVQHVSDHVDFLLASWQFSSFMAGPAVKDVLVTHGLPGKTVHLTHPHTDTQTHFSRVVGPASKYSSGTCVKTSLSDIWYTRVIDWLMKTNWSLIGQSALRRLPADYLLFIKQMRSRASNDVFLIVLISWKYTQDKLTHNESQQSWLRTGSGAKHLLCSRFRAQQPSHHQTGKRTTIILLLIVSISVFVTMNALSLISRNYFKLITAIQVAVLLLILIRHLQ